jgi:hypothetical protein
MMVGKPQPREEKDQPNQAWNTVLSPCERHERELYNVVDDKAKPCQHYGGGNNPRWKAPSCRGGPHGPARPKDFE